MAVSIRYPEDVINLALVDIGYKRLIGSVYDGSDAANLALNIYSETRDEVLRGYDWGFAEKIVPGVVAASPAPFPWSVAYNYPADCIKIRNIFNAAHAGDPNNPLPVLYTVANDPTAGKVILTNVTVATLVYTGQITNPQFWEPGFISVLTLKLSKRLAPALAELEALKPIMEEEKTEIPAMEGIVG